MTWKDRLQDASFRGVPFKVEEESAGTGRRVETHEYGQIRGYLCLSLHRRCFRPSDQSIGIHTSQGVQLLQKETQ